MQVILPPVFTQRTTHDGLGEIRQLSRPGYAVECTAVPYRREKDAGYQLLGSDGTLCAYLFAKQSRTASFDPDEPVLYAKFDSISVEHLDLSHGNWHSHPLSPQPPSPLESAASAARRTWRNAFRFIQEDPKLKIIGLRPPQIGALHAIHAHWSTSTETATVVMPTGTGKTETMLATLISAQCDRVLVVVPTDALRAQISGKFETLGLLRHPESHLLDRQALNPVVGTLYSKPTSFEGVDSFLKICNVIVTTSQLLSGCVPSIQEWIANHCSHLFIDEAHHSEAPTWKSFRKLFENKLVLQFTATPFREDGQKLDGKFIYVYPLKKAQEEGYFQPIRFRQVREFDMDRGDVRIAEAAVDELQKDATGKHIVMARVDGKSRASKIAELYNSFGTYLAVELHSGISAKECSEAKRKLFFGEAQIVVCVDMLGEGFDLPELKIAAFHDIRKSLPVTLQLAGRFTRSRSDLGNPVFIANTALVEVSEELHALYSQDPDWNSLLPDISKSAIDEEIESQEFFSGFGKLPTEIPLRDIRPAASMVVYKTHCSKWSPKNYRKGFRGLGPRDKLFSSLNEDKKTLLVLAATEHGVKWSDVDSLQEYSWELLIAVWDKELELLYLHGSDISGDYKDLAKALCGSDVELVIAPNLFRCFHGIKRLTLNNVGLNEHLGRQVRYTGRMGADVETRIGQAARQGATKAVLAGQGFERGDKTTIGAAKRGRVWAHLRLRVDSFSSWAKTIGRKLADESIDPDAVLAGTLKPEIVGEVPKKVAIAADWPIKFWERSEHSVHFQATGFMETDLTSVELSICDRDSNDPIVLQVSTNKWSAGFALSIFSAADTFDFKYEQIDGPTLKLRVGRTMERLDKYFTEIPPTVWFSDGSSLEGCHYVELPSAGLPPFPVSRLTVWRWDDVDITRESQGEEKNPGTIQFRVIESLKNDSSYQIVFDDDGAGEAADVLAIRIAESGEKQVILVDMYHCKYAGGKPGGRIDDLYVVCGQAQRSASWLGSHEKRTDLFTHLLRRNALRVDNGRASRLERGDDKLLFNIRDMSRRCEVKIRVTVVQPGLSAASASQAQLLLLAVTERYLSDTYEIPFGVICSA